ncbi:MAG: cellulose binding domain-containing protein, partial [Micromonosporaceae bacterium]|nr:cellulose binding domain-containing protein [Micromonosporaceae bacterium]
VMASPLMAGNDLRSMDQATQTILKNKDLIAINQDALGVQAAQISFDGTRRVLAKRLANGDVAVALFNQGTATTTISTTAAAIGLSGSAFTLRDAWTGAATSSTGTISASVAGHATAVYRVARAGGGPSGATASSTSPSPSLLPSGSGGSSSTPSPVSGCRVTYTMSSWNSGFTADVAITNTSGSPVSGWSLRFTLPSGQTVASAWNATITPASGQVTASNVSYNATIAAGASVSFGFQATHTGSPVEPAAFTLNGVACTTS